MIIIPLIFAVGCSRYFDDRRPLEDQPTGLLWQGWVYEDIPQEDTPGLENGSITIEDQDGEVLTYGEQMDDTRPSVWTLEVPESSEVAIRIEGSPEHYTTVWRTRTPAAPSYWYAGSLFAVRKTTIQPLWTALSELLEEPIGESDGAHLYGESLMLWPEDEAAWTGADITVYDAEGTVHPAITLSTLDDGMMVLSDEGTGPITAFAATDLSPGPVRLVINTSDGRAVVMDYNAQSGDLLSAFAFTLPEPDQ